MSTYLLRRTIQAIPLFFILSILLFGLVRMAPGGPLAQAARNPNVTQEQLERIRRELGLDQPLYIQYGRWFGSVLQGDLGKSIKSNRPVATMIGERIPNTLLLITAAFGLTLLLAIPIAACIKFLVEEIVVPHVKAWAKGEKDDLLPVGRGR